MRFSRPVLQGVDADVDESLVPEPLQSQPCSPPFCPL